MIASYRKAIEVKSDFADAYLNLGVLLKEEVEEAIRSLLLAVNLDPTLRTGFFQLFHAFLGAGSDGKTSLVTHFSSICILSRDYCLCGFST